MRSWREVLAKIQSLKLESRDLPLIATLGGLGALVIALAIRELLLLGLRVHVLLQPPGNERGSMSAPVTIVEYVALDCTNCIDFEERVLPRILGSYVSTGQARIVVHTLGPDTQSLNAAALARCARQDDFFAFIDFVIRQRARWANSRDPRSSLMQVAEAAGMPPDRADACLEDTNVLDPIAEETRTSQRLFSMSSIVLVVDGKPYTGPFSWQTVQAVVDAELARKRRTTESRS